MRLDPATPLINNETAMAEPEVEAKRMWLMRAESLAGEYIDAMPDPS
jgi:hypothetical protein